MLRDNRTGAQYFGVTFAAANFCFKLPSTRRSIRSSLGTKPIVDWGRSETAFLRMKEDALKKRTFSNIVAEYVPGTDHSN